MALTLKSSARCFGGVVRKYAHVSRSTKTEMLFSVFLPASALAESSPVRAPALYFLSGLTCTEDNFMHKAGAVRAAARHGLALVCPDTSPRGEGVPDDEAGAWDFGLGAGFYVNATEAPWKENYRMYEYVTSELPALVRENLPVSDRQGVFGHSMGGHGALVAFLRNPGLFASVSAFSPIAHPSACPWGHKALGGYLGEDREAWKAYDATELVAAYRGPAPGNGAVLIDQGADDAFLKQGQLLPGDFCAAAKAAGVPVEYREHAGYDHGYYFISTFVDAHIDHHAAALLR